MLIIKEDFPVAFVTQSYFSQHKIWCSLCCFTFSLCFAEIIPKRSLILSINHVSFREGKLFSQEERLSFATQISQLEAAKAKYQVVSSKDCENNSSRVMKTFPLESWWNEGDMTYTYCLSTTIGKFEMRLIDSIRKRPFNLTWCHHCSTHRSIWYYIIIKR